MDIKRIDFRKKVQNKTQAAFVIVYSLEGKPWENYREADVERKDLVIPTCMMINRWDGTVGFIGGKVEKGDTFEKTIKKEVKEEIGHDFDLKLEEVVAHDIGPITTHAFASEVSYNTLRHIQKDAAVAEDMGSEVTGVFLPHLVDYSEITTRREGGIVEVYKTSMAPSVREELTHFLLNKKVHSKQELEGIIERAGYSLKKLLS